MARIRLIPQHREGVDMSPDPNGLGGNVYLAIWSSTIGLKTMIVDAVQRDGEDVASPSTLVELGTG